MAGMNLNVYRSGTDCTNNGISKYFDSLTVEGDGVAEIFYASKDSPAMKLVIRNAGGASFPILTPADSADADGDRWYMFGGNFAYTSDSRMSNWMRERGFDCAPIKIFDRYEG